MKRLLIQLAIFSLFFWVILFATLYTTSPTTTTGQWIWSIILLVIFLAGGAVLCTTTLILSAYKATRPNQKLPPLLVRDSLIQGLFVASGITGLLMLQLLRIASWLNIALWLLLVFGLDWTLKAIRNNQDSRRISKHSH